MKKKTFSEKIFNRISNKIATTICNVFYAIFDCGSIQIDITLPNVKCIHYRLFGKTIFIKEYHNGKRVKFQKYNNNSIPTVFLKVNRDTTYTLTCIQMWLNAVYERGYNFFFVCDNNLLKRKILQNCKFKNGDIKFIRSIKGRRMKWTKNLYYGKSLEKMTYAHLTPFLISKKMGIKQHWAIDADDTLLFMDSSKLVSVMSQVEHLSNNEGISAISLDMHFTKTFGRCWSLGVLFVNDNVDFCKIFRNEKNLEWTNYFQQFVYRITFDQYMTHLKFDRKLKIETFYVENCYFLHWGEFLQNPEKSWLCIWKNNKMYYPFMKIFHNSDIEDFDIPRSTYQISVGLTEKESMKFFEFEVSTIGSYPDKTRLLYGFNTYARRN